MAAQGAGGEVGFGHRVGAIHRQHGGYGAGGTAGLLPFEGFDPVEGGGRYGPGATFIGSAAGFEGLETTVLVVALPSKERGQADRATGRMGDLMADRRQIFAQLMPGSG